MNRKVYSAPEAEIELFKNNVVFTVTVSGGLDSGDNSGSSGGIGPDIPDTLEF